MKDLIIIGAGAFGEDMLDNIRQINKEAPRWNVLGFIDDVRTGEIDGVKILGNLEDFLKMDKSIQYFVAILNCKARERIMNACKAAGFTGATICSLGVHIAEDVSVDEGCYIGFLSEIKSGCRLERGVILEHKCLLCANTTVGAYSTCRNFLSTGRSVKIGRYNHFDLRCTVDDGVTTVDDCCFGIGSSLLCDATISGGYAGIPAKPVPVTK